jgi:hypothetical protein
MLDNRKMICVLCRAPRLAHQMHYIKKQYYCSITHYRKFNNKLKKGDVNGHRGALPPSISGAV